MKKEKMSKYQQTKEKIRNEAIEYQRSFENHDYSYGELSVLQNYFETMGKRYGLLREFRENCIC